MPSYKLTYFNARGGAECCRLVFAAAGVKYEDVRFTREEWQTKKNDSKFGMVPELDVDGKTFAQSRAIMFYLAKEFGFYPSSNIEQLAVDEVIFLLEDIKASMVKVFFAKPEEKEALMKDFKVQLVKFMGCLEKNAKSNGDNGFMVGSKTSVADIAVFDTVTGMVTRFEPAVLDSYPAVKKVADRVGAIAGIKKWIAERPKSDF